VEEGTWLKAETAVSATATAKQTTDRKTETKGGSIRMGVSWEQRRVCIRQLGGDSSESVRLARDLREAAARSRDRLTEFGEGLVVFS
jgi:hypothetical protein